MILWRNQKSEIFTELSSSVGQKSEMDESVVVVSIVSMLHRKTCMHNTVSTTF